MGTLTDGTLVDCTADFTGGVQKAWFQSALDFTFTPGADLEYSAMASVGTNVFIPFEFQDEEAELKGAYTAAGSTEIWTYTFDFVVPGAGTLVRKAIKDLGACSKCGGLIGIFLMMDDSVLIGGFQPRRRFKLETDDFTSGRTLETQRQTQPALVSKMSEPIYTFTGGEGGILV